MSLIIYVLSTLTVPRPLRNVTDTWGRGQSPSVAQSRVAGGAALLASSCSCVTCETKAVRAALYVFPLPCELGSRAAAALQLNNGLVAAP